MREKEKKMRRCFENTDSGQNRPTDTRATNGSSSSNNEYPASSNDSPALRFVNLTKNYPGFTLGPVDLSLPRGRVLTFIGPNGAGKTTLLNCIIGVTLPDKGSIDIVGQTCSIHRSEWKTNVGYVGERHGFYQNWSAGENLKFISGFYPSWDASNVRRLAAKLSLPLDKRVCDLSKGNRSKLALLAAIGHHPPLLLLDEPFTGLDPLVRDEVHDLLWGYLEDGNCSIIYSTHILSDISRLADDLAFLVDGKIVLKESKDTMTENWRRISFYSEAKVEMLPGIRSISSAGKHYQLISHNHSKTLAKIKTLPGENIETARMSIDEIAVEVMKGHADVAHIQS